MLEDTGAKTLTYLYDFGDGWEHTIKVERIGAAAPGEIYPRVLEASCRCPPEDICGPPGYAEFLAAMPIPTTSATTSSPNTTMQTSIPTS